MNKLQEAREEYYDGRKWTDVVSIFNIIDKLSTPIRQMDIDINKSRNYITELESINKEMLEQLIIELEYYLDLREHMREGIKGSVGIGKRITRLTNIIEKATGKPIEEVINEY